MVQTIVQDLLVQFSEAANGFGQQLIAWGNPDIEQGTQATAGWPMTRLDHALYGLLPYLVIVACGVVCYQKPPPRDKNAKRPPPKPLSEILKADPIKSLMIVYNAAQVFLCGWMTYAAIMEAREQNYSLVCNAFRPKETGMATVLWVFYLSKILDFFDTFFIVARGSWAQFSFLHIYHHISIYLVYWLNVNSGFDGDIYFTIVLNSFVHFVMYSYYFMSLIGKPLKNKQIITQLQMLQFICMNAQAIYIMVMGCPFPFNITAFYLVYIISLLFLFGQFYVRSFLAGKGKGKGKGKGGKGE